MTFSETSLLDDFDRGDSTLNGSTMSSSANPWSSSKLGTYDWVIDSGEAVPDDDADEDHENRLAEATIGRTTW